jgi:hypothetical protein
MFFEAHSPVNVSAPFSGRALSRSELRQNLIETLLECEAHGFTAQELLPEQFADCGASASNEAMRQFINEVIASKNPSYTVHCYALVYGIGEMFGVTLQAVANLFGFRKQYVDKTCDEIRTKTGLAASWNGKAHKDAYQFRNSRRG